jgi:hypothetical protein
VAQTLGLRKAGQERRFSSPACSSMCSSASPLLYEAERFSPPLFGNPATSKKRSVALRIRLATGSLFSQCRDTYANSINDRKLHLCQESGDILRYRAVKKPKAPARISTRSPY